MLALDGAARTPGAVLALGRAPVKGTRWQWLDEVSFDVRGVADDRVWALVDGAGRCLRTVANPGLVALDAPVDELALVERSAGEPATVSYWGRPVEAELFDLPWCGPGSAVARLVGVPVRLARVRQQPGFVWHWPVSLLLTSELDGLPGDLARYRPNLVVDDLALPLELREGSVVQLGAATLVCRERLERCAVVNHDPVIPGQVMPVFQSLPDRRLGWGCEVLAGGNVSCGTPVAVTGGH